jgi:hypothetical protein
MLFFAEKNRGKKNLGGEQGDRLLGHNLNIMNIFIDEY